MHGPTGDGLPLNRRRRLLLHPRLAGEPVVLGHHHHRGDQDHDVRAQQRGKADLFREGGNAHALCVLALDKPTRELQLRIGDLLVDVAGSKRDQDRADHHLHAALISSRSVERRTVEYQGAAAVIVERERDRLVLRCGFGYRQLADRFLSRRDALGPAGAAVAEELDRVVTTINDLAQPRS